MTDDLPPSAKFVKKYFEWLPELCPEGEEPPREVPRKQIQHETELPPRTVRRACDRLEDAGIIERAMDWENLQAPVYRLVGQNGQPAEVEG